ncbi:EexN family lipoprotein (plasmid) [Sphingobium yanoikuyae]|jgi:uncharacterized lipoprotein YmbA|uniref:EexN family lipoprotein n=1 Tax=Sphingobium yanoikuyae TaxID=13690 RepID=A0A6P1GRE0_SPHYA|nr:EexN family lipoprotein [Sphingobium yanoikuyae]QHD70843.1 EexN family lipoprotein [Sphingobium yanoikuyae]SCW93543.1 hypothetical protein SAMN02927924_04348 [Sphingobium faniae]
MRKCLIVLAFAALPLAACGEDEKSVEYYMQHLDEAREKAGRCQSNGDAGVNCGNAAVAIQRAAREQFERDRARTDKAIKDGSIFPTWNGK